MPATNTDSISINLLSGDEFARTPIGRIITWATTYGRYIMILTEIVVLLAFISRFSLDRKLTDLKEEISQKQAVIEANQELEQTIRILQQKLTIAKSIIDPQIKPVELIEFIQHALPPDVIVESLDVTPKSLHLLVSAGTTTGLAQLFINLQTKPSLSSIELGDIKKQQLKGIQVELTIPLIPAKDTKKK